MKKYFDYILVTYLFAFIFTSCESDLDMITVRPTEAPANVSINSTEAYICSVENAKDTAFVVSWTKADFGETISCTYVLQLDVAGNNFANPYELTVGNNVFRRGILSEEINTAMHKLGQPTDVPTNIEIKVAARPIVLGSAEPQLTTLTSTSKVTVIITSYAMPSLHMIGSMFDWYLNNPVYFWNNVNYEYVMFRDNPLAENTYTSYFFGVDGTGLKGEIRFIENGDLGGWTMHGKAGKGILVIGGGSNIQDITKDGYYTITANMITLTYSITPYDATDAPAYNNIQLLGTGISSAVSLRQTHYDKHIWIADDITLTGGNLKFQSEDSSVSWAGSTFPWGKGENTDETIPVTVSGNYFVKFNDLTGHYIFYKK